MSAVEQNKQRMYSLAKKIIDGDYKGFSGKPIKNIVNVGIGGSNESFWRRKSRTHF